MGRADRLTIESGKPGIVLMKAAGNAVARRALDTFPSARRILVACGPGNNGGDGYVAALALHRAGRAVTVAAFGDPARLAGDAALARDDWRGPIEPLDTVAPDGFDLVIDALFGAGITRPLVGSAGAFVEALNASGLPVIAVDVPSGVDGSTGAALGTAVAAHSTVTFFRRKPGHCLLPGRTLSGPVTVAQIGIDKSVLDAIRPAAFENGPALWPAALAPDEPGGHKYGRGHVAVFSGGAAATGAARLAASTAAHAGAGLVSLMARRSAILVNANHATAIMVKRLEPAEEIAAQLDALRIAAVAIGPGFGTGEEQADDLDAVLRWASAGDKHVVVDADALTVIAGDRGRFAPLLGGHCIMTPHMGEFRRLFPALADAPRLDAVRAASAESDAVVVLKGADTVVASSDGTAAINTNAPPAHATAGSGDVLCGAIAALAGRGLEPLAAAAAGVWLHGEAGRIAGPALTADDLPQALGTARAALLPRP
ncbi:MAG: NAD(P)H-hydrate dehydratase [Rhodobiaceae bacterium]|nr:NAD(P)H-hydrate dehydratase [Rhodobiaceae bacterium]